MIVDAVRLVVYGVGFFVAQAAHSQQVIRPVVVGVVCACLGAFVGKMLLPKVTLRAAQLTVAMMMIVVGSTLAAGLI